MKFLLSTLILFVFIEMDLNAQSIDNVRYEKRGAQIFIYYDLKGDLFSRWTITVSLSQDGGTTWGNPLQNLSGVIGKGIRPGANRCIIWDIQEGQDYKGPLDFLVKAKPNESEVPVINKKLESPEFYRLRRGKNIWFASALAFSAAGIYSQNQTEKYYRQYKNATTEAPELHSKIELYNKIYPLAFCAGGICALGCILNYTKQKKAKRPISLEPGIWRDGVLFTWTCNF